MKLGPYSPAWGLLVLMQHYEDNPEVLLSLPKCGEKPLDSSMGMKAVKALIIYIYRCIMH